MVAQQWWRRRSDGGGQKSSKESTIELYRKYYVFVYQIDILRSFLHSPHTDRFPDDIEKVTAEQES